MLRHLLYPILPYRSFLFPILVLSAITVPCWVIFRLYHRRSSGRRPSIAREVLLGTTVVYLSALAAVTLIPSRPSRAVAESTRGVDVHLSAASLACASTSMPVGGRAHGFCVRNARGNVLLFVPLGFLLPLVWGRLRFWQTIQVALALSIGIELLQYLSRAWGSQRTADVNDVVLNVVGACIGLALASLLRLRGRAPAKAVRA